MQKKLQTPLSLIILALLVLVGCGGTVSAQEEEEKTETISQQGARTVQETVVGSGDVQVTLTWPDLGRDPDFDLYVQEPSGEVISFRNRQSEAGGQLDLDANAGCRQTNPQTENIFWPVGQSQTGTYLVTVVLWSACQNTSAEWTLTINVGGQIIHVYSETTTDMDQRPVLNETLYEFEFTVGHAELDVDVIYNDPAFEGFDTNVTTTVTTGNLADNSGQNVDIDYPGGSQTFNILAGIQANLFATSSNPCWEANADTSWHNLPVNGLTQIDVTYTGVFYMDYVCDPPVVETPEPPPPPVEETPEPTTCEGGDPYTDITGSWIVEGYTASLTNSGPCDLTVGWAEYFVLSEGDDWLTSQVPVPETPMELFIPAGATVEFNLPVATGCWTQVDIYRGDHIESFADGATYNATNSLILADFINEDLGLCDANGNPIETTP